MSAELKAEELRKQDANAEVEEEALGEQSNSLGWGWVCYTGGLGAQGPSCNNRGSSCISSCL
jgi:hypothetical protein